MSAAAIILCQVIRAGDVIVLAEALDIGVTTATIPTIDVLVIVANGKQREFVVFVLTAAPGEGADEVIVRFTDILVFIDENIAEASENFIARVV